MKWLMRYKRTNLNFIVVASVFVTGIYHTSCNNEVQEKDISTYKLFLGLHLYIYVLNCTRLFTGSVHFGKLICSQLHRNM